VTVLFRDGTGTVVSGEAADGTVIVHPETAKAPGRKAKAPETPAEKTWPDPVTAKKWLAAHPQPGLVVWFDPDKAVYRLRPVGTPSAITKQPTPAKVPDKKTDPAAKPAVAPKPKTDKPKVQGKSSDPLPSELPDGFDDWLVKQGSTDQGILRTEINRRLGKERRWQNHLKELGKQRGYAFSMQRDGRFTRFFLTKIKK